MIYQIIDLPAQFPALKEYKSEAKLYAYARENSEEMHPSQALPSILICPGGGYSFTSDREAEPVALHFLALGYQVFILRYTCAPAHFPTQLLEAASAIQYIRMNAGDFSIDADKITVMGFSAGAHVAGSLACMWDNAEVCKSLSVKQPSELRPNAACLCYPVITSGKYAHQDSFVQLLGENPSKSLLDSVSLEKAARSDMPPVFIWHTADDGCVPVQNSLLLVNALLEKNVSCELHVFNQGPHGLSLASPATSNDNSPLLVNPHVAQWTELFSQWLDDVLN